VQPHERLVGTASHEQSYMSELILTSRPTGVRHNGLRMSSWPCAAGSSACRGGQEALVRRAVEVP